LERQARLKQSIAAAQDARAQLYFDEPMAQYRNALDLARELDESATVETVQADWIAVSRDKAAALRAAENWDGAATAYRTSFNLAQSFNDDAAIHNLQADLVSLY